jgi:hypothetical protein
MCAWLSCILSSACIQLLGERFPSPRRPSQGPHSISSRSSSLPATILRCPCMATAALCSRFLLASLIAFVFSLAFGNFTCFETHVTRCQATLCKRWFLHERCKMDPLTVPSSGIRTNVCKRTGGLVLGNTREAALVVYTGRVRPHVASTSPEESYEVGAQRVSLAIRKRLGGH